VRGHKENTAAVPLGACMLRALPSSRSLRHNILNLEGQQQEICIEFFGKGGMQTQAYILFLPFYAAIVIFVCLKHV
jgi:hypothetical protein